MTPDQTPVPSAPKTFRYIVLAILISSLIVLLFLGARAWFTGRDRAECILQTRNIQQAIRSHQGMTQLNFGDPIIWSDIIGPGKMIDRKPVCPSGETYTLMETVPPIGTLAGQCSHPEHVPASHHDW